MPRTPLALHVPDLSSFARSLGRALAERHATRQTPPGHVELLNLIARALGSRNIQALRASAAAAAMAAPAPPAPTAASAEPPRALTDNARKALSDNARKALGQFDAQGRLKRWPVKFSVQRLILWPLWTRFDAKRLYTEKEVNAILKDANLFRDHVTLRRELINHKLMTRKPDGSEYRKLPVRPDEEARALLTAWRALQRDASV